MECPTCGEDNCLCDATDVYDELWDEYLKATKYTDSFNSTLWLV